MYKKAGVPGNYRRLILSHFLHKFPPVPEAEFYLFYLAKYSRQEPVKKPPDALLAFHCLNILLYICIEILQ
ncbi:MAG TPA: hypothetical protein DCQ97_04815 [Chitinophagaceae bacterium]|nr:hypothetical protein [Chitinophagaceae bacterium]